MQPLSLWLLGSGLLTTIRPTRRQWFLQMNLLALGAWAAASWHTAFILLGLCYFGQWDWQTCAVPARLFDAWCLLAAATAPHPQWLLSAAWLLGLTIVAVWSGGIGSADVLAISVLAFNFTLTGSLILVLLACASGIIHGLVHPGPIPLLFHLELAFVFSLLTRLLS